MAWFEDMYLGTAGDAAHSHASPLLVKDLRGLPRAWVLTAEFDPLLDQGRAYASRLTGAGNDCVYRHYAGAFHGFLGMPAAIGRRAIDEACAWLKAGFTPD
jgi:acetyl esterase